MFKLAIIKTRAKMGMFFNLFVETGNDNKSIDELVDYFQTIGRIETSFGFHEIFVGKVQNNIGITVGVKETGHSGLDSYEAKRIATQIGYKFYELLQKAPPFKCAMVGVEAGEWFDGQSISEPNFDGYLPEHGLVIKNDLNLNLEGEFVNFKDGYIWTPYKGENNK